MFNLEHAIKIWKRQLRSNPAFEDGDVAELESHLRDEIERLITAGLSEVEAFEKAVREVGEPESIGDELFKTRTGKGNATPPWKQKSWIPSLLPNYIRIAIRNVKKSPVYSIVNITGLATGLACCLLIVIYLLYQFSFDDFHTHKERIYRLNKVVTPATGGTEHHAITSGPMGPQLKRDFPEVQKVVRLLPWFDDVLLTRGENSLKVNRFVLADFTFFEIFDFQLLKGDPSTALTRPLTVIISENVAGNLFGESNPIGQSIEGLNGFDYTVTGVIENAPDNSHLQYDVLASWTSTSPSALDMGWLEGWFPQAVYTYLLLDSPGNETALKSKLGDFMQQHFPQRVEQYELYLQPFSEIYLYSTSLHYDDTVKSGSITNVYIFSAVAILVLLIACINFMNLSTARSVDRAREVGVRKVLGASRNQLGWQFLGESMVLTLIAMVLSLGLIRVGLPVLNYLGMPPEALAFDAYPELFMILSGITLLTGLISGSYPALILSGFKPVRVLYGRMEKAWGGDTFLRKFLVTLQFSLSIILIIGTITIYRQMEFIGDKYLGFQKEQVLVLQLGGTDVMGQKETFREELLRHSNIRNIAASNSVPGSGFMSFGINPEGKDPGESWTTSVIRLGDDNFLETYDMEMAEGRFFSEELAGDSNAVVINEALARSLGWENPLGRQIDVSGELSNGRVIGVIKDFHTASLHNTVEPLLLFLENRGSFLSLRVEPRGLDQTLAYIEETWKQFDPDFPFEYFFLDDHFAAFYSAEQKILRVVFIFTGLAIFVACLGLFGLSTFMIQQRTKEIGIRKILGSSVPGIIELISKDFLKLVGAGFLIAIPAAWLLTGQWLKEFAYRTEIGAGVFLIAGFIALVLALVAVLWQSVRAARMNPVESLRSE